MRMRWYSWAWDNNSCAWDNNSCAWDNNSCAWDNSWCSWDKNNSSRLKMSLAGLHSDLMHSLSSFTFCRSPRRCQDDVSCFAREATDVLFGEVEGTPPAWIRARRLVSWWLVGWWVACVSSSPPSSSSVCCCVATVGARRGLPGALRDTNNGICTVTLHHLFSSEYRHFLAKQMRVTL